MTLSRLTIFFLNNYNYLIENVIINNANLFDFIINLLLAVCKKTDMVFVNC